MPNPLKKLATPGGLEPPTNSLEGCCSIQLSYGAGHGRFDDRNKSSY